MAFHFLLFFLLLPALAFSQEFFPVYWKKDLPPLHDIFYFNASTGMVVGDLATILKTTDEGYSWEALNAPTTENLKAVFLISAESAFIAGENGIILKTTNGGQSWLPQNSLTDQALLDIAFWNENLGFAAGTNGTILKTADGGNTWTHQDVATSARLNALSVVSETVIYIAADDGIWKSSDAGESWINENYDFTEDINTSSNRIDDINFITEETGFILNYGYNGSLQQVLKTINAGQSWESMLGSGSFLTSISFESENNGFATGLMSNSYIYKFTGGNLQENWYLPQWWDWMYRSNFSYKIHTKNNSLNSLNGYVLEFFPEGNNIDNFTFYDFKISKSTEDIQDRNVLMGIFSESRHLAGVNQERNNFYNQVQLVKVNADSSVSVLKTLETDSEGLFSFNTFENDSIYLKVIPYDREVYATYYYPDHFTINEAEPFVFNNNNFQAIQYGLMPRENMTGGTGVIEGIIYQPSGQGKKDLPLVLVSQNNNIAAMAKTDEQGSYRFSNLKQGQYKLLVDLPFAVSEAPIEIAVEQESQILTANFTLQKNLLVLGKQTIPAAPENLQASQVDQNFISLTWEDKSDNELTFLVEKSTEDAPFELLTELPEGKVEFMDEAVVEGKKYNYRVQAKNGVGKSAYSNIASYTTILTPLGDFSTAALPMVYPNPIINDKIFIGYSKNTSYTKNVSLFDSNGKLLAKYDRIAQVPDDLQIISTKDFLPGLYLLKIQIDERFYNYKLIKR